MRRCSHLDDPLIHAYEERVTASAAYHESLSTLPPAKLKKFEDGQPLPFSGYSLVQWIYSDQALWHELTALIEALQEDFARERIKEYFYFLSAATLHATVRDLLLGEPHSEANYAQAVRSAFNRQAELRMKPPDMQVEGVSFIGKSSIAVILHPVDRESLSTLVQVRRIVEEELRRTNEIFTELDAADFFGHVTLAYPVGDLTAEIYGKAKGLVKSHSQRAGLIGDLALDAVQLRRFDSMVDWSEPLETLRFGTTEMLG
jgi:hypothetical protein